MANTANSAVSKRSRPLCIINPAPTSSEHASPTSPIASRLGPRSSCRRVGAPLTNSGTPPRIESSAGGSPNRMPLASESARAKPKALTPIPALKTGGARASNMSPPHHASSTPRAPPRRESRTLSVITRLKSRSLPAPMAVRTASSLRRIAPCASSKLAQFAQASGSNRATAADIHSITECQ